MPATLKLRIVTPERELLDTEVEEVVAPGALGEFGVLPDHVAFLTTLGAGRLAYRAGGRRHVVAIFGGYAEVAENVMTVLADGAEPAQEIDFETARRALREAEERLAALDSSAPEWLAARRDLEREAARVAAAADRS